MIFTKKSDYKHAESSLTLDLLQTKLKSFKKCHTVESNFHILKFPTWAFAQNNHVRRELRSTAANIFIMTLWRSCQFFTELDPNLNNHEISEGEVQVHCICQCSKYFSSFFSMVSVVCYSYQICVKSGTLNKSRLVLLSLKLQDKRLYLSFKSNMPTKEKARVKIFWYLLTVFHQKRKKQRTIWLRPKTGREILWCVKTLLATRNYQKNPFFLLTFSFWSVVRVLP